MSIRGVCVWICFICMHIDYSNLISISNFFQAWDEFRKGKSKRLDVQTFERNLEDNLFKLKKSLEDKTYRHGGYNSFYVNDPKQRHIHKASVADRIVHHLLYTFLYKLFDSSFIYDSYSCRLNKGTHKGVKRLETFTRVVSRNYTRPCFALKYDIKKFFASIDHSILKQILSSYIPDKDLLWLLDRVIDSFSSGMAGVGLPLGNLTSQLLVNIYLNEFDQYVKHRLKARYYIRYADDFVIFLEDRKQLESLIPAVRDFLLDELRLTLHPNKIFIKTLTSGVDFLGWINFADHRILRTMTKRRMMKRIKENPKPETINSYLGLLKHGNAYKLKNLIPNDF